MYNHTPYILLNNINQYLAETIKENVEIFSAVDSFLTASLRTVLNVGQLLLLLSLDPYQNLPYYGELLENLNVDMKIYEILNFEKKIEEYL